MDMNAQDNLAKTIWRAMKGKSLYRVSKDSGVAYQSVYQFAHGGDMRLSTASRLCKALGLELRPVEQKGAK